MLKVFLPNCAQLIGLSCSRDDLRLLGTRQRSESDDTGTRVKIRLHSIMGRVTFSCLLSE